MDQKKLTNILVKDIGELDDLIADLKLNQQIEYVDIEYIHTRLRGIRQIAEMLVKTPAIEPHARVEPAVQEKHKVSSSTSEKTDISKQKNVAEPIHNQEIVVNHTAKQEVHDPEKNAVNAEPLENKEPEIATIPVEEPGMDSFKVSSELLRMDENTGNIYSEESVMLKESLIEPANGEEFEPQETGPEVLPGTVREKEVFVKIDESEGTTGQTIISVVLKNEITVEKDEPKILGEKFTKEKSLNDLLSDPVKLESKLINRPIDNLSSTMGINDRFLFVRELFGGDGNRFNQVIKQIDSFTTIHEAVAYLKENFQWKNSETSLKFLSMVKRRFSNE